ncbi:MAG: NAD(P)/FAD-dependent oxidoreductase [Lachnospiraceae bacterium]
MRQYDVAVIGAGVVGCAIARELSRYRLRVCVLEKELDVACGNSSRNTGMLHAGFTYKPGSLKAICAVEGSREFDQVARELDIPFRRTGKVVVGFTETDRKNILKYKAIGEQNGVEGLEMIDQERLYEIEPEALGEFAMYSPASGILDPMQYTIALAENAAENGVEFLFGNEVISLLKQEHGYRITTSKAVLDTRWVINSAGMYSTRISDMLGLGGYVTKGFKGEYYVLDKKAGKGLSVPVYPAPNEKGGFATHATITIDGNVLVGPDSYLTEGREDYAATREHLAGLVRDGQKMFDKVRPEYFIRTFAGIRWKRVDPITGEVQDFVLERREEAPYAVNLVGIESPGLTCALPLARRVVDKIKEIETLIINPEFNPERKGIVGFSELNLEEKKRIVARQPEYGEIICRCESVTKGEILQAIHNPLGVHTVTGIKNRTRATMGRCQGGYCETRITTLICEELNQAETQVRYQREGSYMFTGKVRGE